MRILSTLIPVALLLASTATAQTCTFTNFGRACGADLAGSLARGPAIQMDVSNAAPGSIAIFVAGHRTNRPHPLPNSNCLLVVEPRITLLEQVNLNGNARFLMRMPNVTPLAIDFQAVTIALNRNGRTAESSNGVTMVCR
jgi:hypothetical protein